LRLTNLTSIDGKHTSQYATFIKPSLEVLAPRPSITGSISPLFFVQGPTKTPYEGGVFELDIKVPDLYPLVPPVVYYRTKIFHPNVHFKVGASGCAHHLVTRHWIQVLASQWSSAQSLLGAPGNVMIALDEVLCIMSS